MTNVDKAITVLKNDGLVLNEDQEATIRTQLNRFKVGLLTKHNLGKWLLMFGKDNANKIISIMENK